MGLKRFDAVLTQTLNGIDTYTFKHVVNSASVATRYAEGTTMSLNINGMLAFGGTIKATEVQRSGFIKSITAESVIHKLRDTDLQQEDPHGLSRIDKLTATLMPEGITIEYNVPDGQNLPMLEYAFRSGSIITHLNTLCAMNGFNWRSKTVSATEAIIRVSTVDPVQDPLVVTENVDVFNLKVDKSLFKQYTKVTAVGVENEISGYTCTASYESPVRYALDCDDGEVGDDEILIPNSEYQYLTNFGRYQRIDIRYGSDLKGWGDNTHVLINGEILSFSSKSGSVLLGVERNQWGTAAIEDHLYGDPVCLVNKLALLPLTTSTDIQPPTTLFKIGTEIVQGTIEGAALILATVNATTLIYEGRGLAYDEFDGSFAYSDGLQYAHKRGTVVIPYYPNGENASAAEKILDVTVHGKGIVTKDGIDKLAWGVLNNLQNGILSGSCTYKSGDFGDINIGVGQKMFITTASVQTSTATSIVPATEYETIIYSITRKQNKLLEIEFGNVVPEVLNLLKSGEYALQAAIRKTPVYESKPADGVSISGKLVSYNNGKNKLRVNW